MTQVAFLSYAREDDEKPPFAAEAVGFVCALHSFLKYEFTLLPRPRPDIWQDIENVRGGDLFDPKIAAAINGSSLFIAVLSSNWLASEYCQKELRLFRQRWAHEDDAAFRQRVVVVHYNFVERASHPPQLTGQTGYRFFKFANGREGPGRERFFFRGKIVDEDYLALIRDLAVHLWERSSQLGVAIAAFEPNAALPAAAEEMRSPPARAASDAPARPSVARNGRTIYLAKAGPELEPAYQRIARELVQQGYEICPAKNGELPSGDGADAAIDEALARCEVSVHLIGIETPGDAGLTRLQLARAAQRVGGSGAQAARPLRRIVWAPKVLQVDTGLVNGSPSRPRILERDPLEVLLAADGFLPTDKVDGGAIDDFVIFLLQNLDSAGAGGIEVEPEAALSEASDCYIYYDNRDSALARRVARALRQRGVEPILPSKSGDDSLRETLHRQRLQECDAVVLCWGESPDSWAQSYSHQLRDWKQLGRTKQFKVRGLVVGPPPDEEKEDIEFWPKREIDVVIPVDAPDGPSPESLADLGIGTGG